MYLGSVIHRYTLLTPHLNGNLSRDFSSKRPGARRRPSEAVEVALGSISLRALSL